MSDGLGDYMRNLRLGTAAAAKARSTASDPNYIAAKASGAKTYTPSKPCKNGHTERNTSNRNCIECERERGRKYDKARYEKRKNRMMKRNRVRNGIPEATRPIPEKCELCGKTSKRSLCRDHDHKTGKFRGWICSNCNTALGKLGDNGDGVFDAVKYLLSSRSEEFFPGDRKEYSIFTGMLGYFPNACAEVARCSFIANEQHNPGQPIHWDRSKSIGRGDELIRHLMDGSRETWDSDGVRHLAKCAWRALELLQRQIEAERSGK